MQSKLRAVLRFLRFGRIYPGMPVSGTLFPISELPEGLLYQPDFLSRSEEEELILVTSAPALRQL